jgi:hypothetical protein
VKLPRFLFVGFLIVSFFGCLLAGCGTLNPAGAYGGDAVLYQADQTISTSFAVLDQFVTWEKSAAPTLVDQPQIHAAAERIRQEAPAWFAHAIAVRDAYAANKTAENAAALNVALAVIQQALTEATTYMSAHRATSAAIPRSTISARHPLAA